MTPEGKIKELVKKALIEIGCIPAAKALEIGPQHVGWFFMPVPFGMGVAGIPDFIGCYKGLFFAIETKAKGKNPTPLQQAQINALAHVGGMVRVVDSPEEVERVKLILKGATP